METQTVSQTLIRATNLKKYYNLGETTVKALDGVDLTVDEGEFVAIVGPSGSGKSTLVNMLGGVDTPDEGSITILPDVELSSLKPGDLTDFRRKYVGFVFQFYSLIPTLTALENVEMAAELVNLKGKELHQRAEEALESVGLKDRNGSYPSQLSGGERQRVAIARALAKRPRLILVDEPTGQLDDKTADEIVKLIRDVSKSYGSTVLMVTHDRAQLKYADRVIDMRSGKILDV
ncbi:MAG: ABC transporter ATP-binding protein [Candidatus Kariarchaeaceae archaeon]|jgi:putative ABC transport system ATP-binding protein